MNFRFPVVAAALGVSACLSSCTTTETAPDKVSTMDLLMGQDRLKSYVTTRREHLATLQSRADAIQDQIILKFGRLHQLKAQLDTKAATEGASAAELREIRAQVQSREAALNGVLKRTSDTKQAITAINQQKIEAETRIAADTAARIEAAKAVEELEKDNQLINNAVDRSLQLRVEQLLKK